jgi:hypothetical protein
VLAPARGTAWAPDTPPGGPGLVGGSSSRRKWGHLHLRDPRAHGPLPARKEVEGEPIHRAFGILEGTDRA